MKYYFGFWGIHFLLCLIDNYHRYEQDVFFFFKKVIRNFGFSFKVRFFKFIFYVLQGFLGPLNYEVAPQILENNYQRFSATWKQIAPVSRSPKPLWANIQTLSFIQLFFQWRAAWFQCTAIAYCTAFVTLSYHWAIKLLIPMLQRLCCYGGRSWLEYLRWNNIKLLKRYQSALSSSLILFKDISCFFLFH